MGPSDRPHHISMNMLRDAYKCTERTSAIRHDREFTSCGGCEHSARWPSRMVKTAQPSARAGHGAVQPGEDQVQTRPSHERVPTTLCGCQANEASTVLTETRDSGHGAIVRLAGLSRHPPRVKVHSDGDRDDRAQRSRVVRSRTCLRPAWTGPCPLLVGRCPRRPLATFSRSC